MQQLPLSQPAVSVAVGQREKGAQLEQIRVGQIGLLDETASAPVGGGELLTEELPHAVGPFLRRSGLTARPHAGR